MVFLDRIGVRVAVVGDPVVPDGSEFGISCVGAGNRTAGRFEAAGQVDAPLLIRVDAHNAGSEPGFHIAGGPSLQGRHDVHPADGSVQVGRPDARCPVRVEVSRGSSALGAGEGPPRRIRGQAGGGAVPFDAGENECRQGGSSVRLRPLIVHIILEIIGIELVGEDRLLLAVEACAGLSRFAGPVQRGQQHGSENRYNCYYDQQLNEGESTCFFHVFLHAVDWGRMKVSISPVQPPFCCGFRFFTEARSISRLGTRRMPNGFPLKRFSTPARTSRT